ncbi:MAG: diguanylate cyclase [Lysobacterales bacterium]
MRVDVPTLVVVAAVTSALLALAVALTLRGQPPGLRGSVRAWTAGIAIQAAGWLLIGFRGELPDAISIVLANVAIASGYAVCIQALRLFGGQRGHAWTAYALSAGVLLASLVFTYLEPSRHWRMVFNSALLGTIFGLAASTAWRLRIAQGQRPPSHQLLTGVFALGALMLVARAVVVALEGPQPTGGILALSPLVATLYGSTAFGPVLATFGFVLMCNDRLHGELEHLATFDTLTGVYNRGSLERLAAEAVAHARRVGHAVTVMLVDADHFKRINDEFGHEAGDSALRVLAACLQFCARPGDVVGRFGGEEFVVVLPGADEDAGVVVAERLRQRMETLRLGEATGDLALHVSVGVAMRRERDDRYAHVLREADRALYEAKRTGRNRVMAASAMATAEEA